VIYTITIAEQELNNLVIPALDGAIQPFGSQAKSFIMAQVEYQNAQAEELAATQDAGADVTEAPVVDSAPQQAPNVAA
jgi:hypothetical protein